MSKENVLSPEINFIKNDEFYLFYEMMMQSLKTDNVKEGINKSLYLLRTFLNSGNIALFSKNEDGVYVYKLSDLKMPEILSSVGCIINKTSPLVEQKKIFNLELNLSEKFKNLMLLHITVSHSLENDKSECIMVVLNPDKNKELEPLFWERVKDTIQIILKRAASYERNTKAVTTDLLTGLDNRNSYEMRLQSINEEDENLVLAIFDLFRLKYVNDKYTHAKGDEYIKKTAKILNKYWPKQIVITNEDGTEVFKDTSHCVYRVGGDEFVLLTNEQLQLTEIKAGLAQSEISMIDIDAKEKLPLGINFGVVKHNPNESFRQSFMRADDLMQKDKEKMYKLNNLDRRR